MDSTTKRELEPWQLEDAARLKALFEQRAGMGQLKFGAQYDIGSQAAVSHYLNGLRPLNLRAAVKFARGLNCAVADFSPRLAEELPEGLDLPQDSLARIVQDLPDDGGQQVLDFIRYRFERAEKMMASEKAATYMKMIDRITADMERRKHEK